MVKELIYKRFSGGDQAAAAPGKVLLAALREAPQARATQVQLSRAPVSAKIPGVQHRPRSREGGAPSGRDLGGKWRAERRWSNRRVCAGLLRNPHVGPEPPGRPEPGPCSLCVFLKETQRLGSRKAGCSSGLNLAFAACSPTPFYFNTFEIIPQFSFHEATLSGPDT